MQGEDVYNFIFLFCIFVSKLFKGNEFIHLFLYAEAQRKAQKTLKSIIACDE